MHGGRIPYIVYLRINLNKELFAIIQFSTRASHAKLCKGCCFPKNLIRREGGTEGVNRNREQQTQQDTHLKTAPPMLVMLGVYGTAVLLLVSCWPVDLFTCFTSLEVVNETLWSTAC